MKLPADGDYFNCGVMLMDLDQLRKQHFCERAVEFSEAQNGIIDSATSRRSIFCSMDRSTNYPELESSVLVL